MNSDRIVNSHQRKRKGQPESRLKFKTRAQLLIEEYQNPKVTEENLYVIEKVAKMRAL